MSVGQKPTGHFYFLQTLSRSRTWEKPRLLRDQDVDEGEQPTP